MWPKRARNLVVPNICNRFLLALQMFGNGPADLCVSNPFGSSFLLIKLGALPLVKYFYETMHASLVQTDIGVYFFVPSG